MIPGVLRLHQLRQKLPFSLMAQAALHRVQKLVDDGLLCGGVLHLVPKKPLRDINVKYAAGNLPAPAPAFPGTGVNRPAPDLPAPDPDAPKFRLALGGQSLQILQDPSLLPRSAVPSAGNFSS